MLLRLKIRMDLSGFINANSACRRLPAHEEVAKYCGRTRRTLNIQTYAQTLIPLRKGGYIDCIAGREPGQVMQAVGEGQTFSTFA